MVETDSDFNSILLLMTYFPMDEWKFLRNEKSASKNKKYNAILWNKKTKKEKKVPYGDSRYAQYRDSTGLGVFSNKDHLDKSRRKKYKIRHQNFIRPGYFSPSYFSMRFLW